MNKSIKVLLLLVVLLAAGYLGGVFWIGGAAEKEWRQQAAALSAQAPGIDIKVTAYDRSFFSAQVTTEITMTMLQSEVEEPFGISFNSRVVHGPVVFSGGSPALVMVNAETTVDAVSGPWAEWFEQFPELKQLTFSEQVFFNLDYKGVGQLPAFERVFADDSDRLQLSFAGLSTKYSGSLKEEKRLQATLSIPGIELKSDSGEINFNLRNASMQIDMQEILASIYAGTTEVKVESVVLAGVADGVPIDVSFSGLQAGAVVDVTDGMLEEVIVYRVEQVGVDGDTYGPAVVEIALSNLDAKVMSNIQNDLQQAQLALEYNSDDFAEQYIASFKKHLLPLVKKSPKLEIRRLDINTPFGNFTGKGEMQIAGEQVTGIDPPMLLIAALTAGADLQVDKSLLKKIGMQYVLQSLQGQTADASDEVLEMRAIQQAQQNIEGLVAAGLLVDAGDSYQMQAKFDRGSLFVNGQQMQ